MLQASEVPRSEHEHRWFRNLPLPEAEPVDKELLSEDEDGPTGFVPDGLRLATMAAIRDQEIAISRELQSGHRLSEAYGREFVRLE